VTSDLWVTPSDVSCIDQALAGEALGMAGSIYFIVVVAVAVLIAVGIASPIFLVPLVVVGLTILAVPFVLALMRDRASSPRSDEGAGVPSTREASYEPVQEPRHP
jgi:hypothetical protein